MDGSRRSIARWLIAGKQKGTATLYDSIGGAALYRRNGGLPEQMARDARIRISRQLRQENPHH
jgi:hypothetical protein